MGFSNHSANIQRISTIILVRKRQVTKLQSVREKGIDSVSLLNCPEFDKSAVSGRTPVSLAIKSMVHSWSIGTRDTIGKYLTNSHADPMATDLIFNNKY